MALAHTRLKRVRISSWGLEDSSYSRDLGPLADTPFPLPLFRGVQPTLAEMDVLRIREAFAKYRHTRFMKSFSCHLPFGTKDAYVKEIMAADLDKLANLIRICGFLMQTKAYMLWKMCESQTFLQ
jgi:hypothetical protein